MKPQEARYPGGNIGPNQEFAIRLEGSHGAFLDLRNAHLEFKATYTGVSGAITSSLNLVQGTSVTIANRAFDRREPQTQLMTALINPELEKHAADIGLNL